MSVTAKSVIIDAADTITSGNGWAGLRSMEFYNNDVLVELSTSDLSAYVAEDYGTGYTADLIFDTSLSKIGSSQNNGWENETIDTNIRISVVFNSAITFNKIVVNNYHDSGSFTGAGLESVKIYYSSTTVTSTTYGENIGSYTNIFDGDFSEHIASNVADDETVYEALSMNVLSGVPDIDSPVLSYILLSAINTKSVVIDITDNYGSGSTGLRSVEFLYNTNVISLATTDFTSDGSHTETNYASENAFDTSLSKTGTSSNTCWRTSTGYPTNNRIYIVFNSNKTFNAIRINNFHGSGYQTDSGAQNIKIYALDSTISSTTYGDGVTTADLLFDGSIDEHIESDVIDDQYLKLELSDTMNVISGVPEIEQLTLLTNTPNSVLAGIPIIGEPDSGITGNNTFTSVKSVIFDITDAYTSSSFDYVSVREIDFTRYGMSLELTTTDFIAYATSYYGSSYPSNAFDTSLSLTGSVDDAVWQAGFGDVTNVRLIIIFNSPQTFDNIKVNNYHNYGTDTDLGIKNVRIYTSQNEVTNVNYNQDIFDYKLIYKNTFDQHSENDIREDQWLLLSDPVLVMDVLTQEPGIDSFNVATMGVIAGVPVVGSLSTFHVFAPNNVVSGIPDIDELVVELQLFNYCSFDAEIPIDFEMSAGTGLDITFPKISMSASFYTGRIGNIEAILPNLSLLMTIGSYIDVSLKSFSMTGIITKEELANILLQFPSLSASFISSFAQTGNIEASLKTFQLNLNSLSGNIINFNSQLPKLILINTLLSGITGDLEMILPMSHLNITSITSGDNDFEATLPELELVLFGDKLACSVLNYVKGKVR